MSARPAASFLAEFGAPELEAPPPFSGIGAPEACGADAEAIEEAYARGLEAGAASARAELDETLEAQRQQFAADLEGARQQWAAGVGAELADALVAAQRGFEARIGQIVERILKPVLSEQLRRRTIADLQETLQVLVSAEPGAVLHVTGPEEVLAGIRAQLADKPALTVTYVPSESCEVRIAAGQAVLETRFIDWLTKLEEAIA